jgi:preprotein translocase subunit SecG
VKGDFTVTILLTVLQVIGCLGLIASVLLQSGKSAGLSGAITGGAETFFGKKGMDDKFATWSKVFAVAFMVLTYILAVLG